MASAASESTEDRAVRKAYWRLMWFLMLLFCCAYLDRINMSYAALTMNRDLGLTATMFGLANSIFYVAYVAAEIPSTMLMQRFGARVWIARIMIACGLTSFATLFATGPLSLYSFRTLIGLAEAGFVPCILLYMTFWFPPAYRARATTLFIMAQPITIMVGALMSGLILKMDGVLGLGGWRWLFMLEGIPSLVLGIAAYFYLSNGPAQARWLTAQEKALVASAVARAETGSGAAIPRGPRLTLWRELLSLPVALLSLAYFGLVVSNSTNSTWVPQIVRGVAPASSVTMISIIAGFPSLVTVCLMPIWGRHSDRQLERTWHVVLPMLLASCGWLFVATSDSPNVKFVGLVFCSVGAFSAQAIFWTLPAQFLSLKARPVGIALVNTIGLLGSITGPIVIGRLKDLTGDFSAGLMFVGGVVGAGAFCIILVSRIRPSAGDADQIGQPVRPAPQRAATADPAT